MKQKKQQQDKFVPTSGEEELKMRDKLSKQKIITDSDREIIEMMNAEKRLENKKEKLKKQKQPRKVDIKIQKHLFKLYNDTLAMIYEKGNGMILVVHLLKLMGKETTEKNFSVIHETLDILVAAGLINFIPLRANILIQLTRISITLFQSKDAKAPTLADKTILKNVMIGELVTSLLGQNDRKTFLNFLERKSTFFRVAREEDLENWKMLDRLKRQDAYILNVDKHNVTCYLLNLYDSSMNQIAIRIVNIFKYLKDNHFLDVADEDIKDARDATKLVTFKVICQDSSSYMSLTAKSAEKTFKTIVSKRSVEHLFLTKEVISLNLTKKYFHNKRF